MTQEQAFEIIKTGVNVFLTGPAGSGKTHVLNRYIDELKRRDIPLGITASTGIAATHMGGVTIHSWCGIGIKDYFSDEEIDDIANKEHVKKKVKNAKVLIIDEVSMLHDFRLDSVDRVLRRVKGINLPFGGMQVILCGDFFQLPPIMRENGAMYNELFLDEDNRTNFAYHSAVWKNASFVICYLEEQYRQSDDSFTKILNEIRSGDVSPQTIKTLRDRIGTPPLRDKVVEPTRLYSHNVNVDSENERELRKLAGKSYQYRMTERGNRKLIESLKKSCLAPETLELKKDAKVMFVKNNPDQCYVNGTLGRVEECSENRIVVRTNKGDGIEVTHMDWTVEEDGRFLAEISQYPLRLAWAITIHKSQGMSLDAAIVDLSQSFEKGMGYVALSRIRTLDGLSLIGLGSNALDVHEEALEYDQYFRETSAKQTEDFLKLPPEEVLRRQIEFLGPEPQAKKHKMPKEKKPKIRTELVTRKFIDEGKSIKEAADARNMVFSTILNHIERIKSEDPTWNISHLRSAVPVTKFARIAQAFHKIGTKEGGMRPLTPVMTVLKSSGGAYSYEELRIVRLFL